MLSGLGWRALLGVALLCLALTWSNGFWSSRRTNSRVHSRPTQPNAPVADPAWPTLFLPTTALRPDQVFLRPHWPGSGMGNHFASTLDTIALALMQAVGMPSLLEYYDVQGLPFCSQFYSAEEIRRQKARARVINQDSLCSAAERFRDVGALMISGWAFRFFKCTKTTGFSKLMSVVRSFPGVPADASVPGAIYYSLLTRFFTLRAEWREAMIRKYPSLRPDHNGTHLRTFGFFREWKEPITIKRFNISRVLELLRQYTESPDAQMFVSLDSRKLRGQLQSALSATIDRFLFNDNRTVHSSDKSTHHDEGTMLDLEVLSTSSFLVTTFGSSYSRIAFFRNRNCLLGRCYDLNPFGYRIYG